MTSELNYAKSAAERQRGRPREFDLETALDQAVRIFSARGFHGTSITDLTEAMQLAKGSIYKAFGDKQGVFLAAFERYQNVRADLLREEIGEAGSGLERLRRVLDFYVRCSQGEEGLLGCMTVNSAAGLSAFEPEIAKHVVHALGRNEILLRKLLSIGIEDGSIPANVDPDASAQMLVCLIQGMRVVGKAGRTKEKMQAAIEVALKSIA